MKIKNIDTNYNFGFSFTRSELFECIAWLQENIPAADYNVHISTKSYYSGVKGDRESVYIVLSDGDKEDIWVGVNITDTASAAKFRLFYDK